MLPSSSNSLQEGGMSSKAAAWTLIACFLAGVFGIQILSRLIHHCMPSHVVDCDHEHAEDEQEHEGHHNHHHHDHEHTHDHREARTEAKPANGATERSPLLDRPMMGDGIAQPQPPTQEMVDLQKTGQPSWLAPPTRPSLKARTSQTIESVSKFVTGSKMSCDADGPCFGYSDPCGRECFKIVSMRGGTRGTAWALPPRPNMPPQRHSMPTTSFADAVTRLRNAGQMGTIDEEALTCNSAKSPITYKDLAQHQNSRSPQSRPKDQPPRPSSPTLSTHSSNCSSASNATDPPHKQHHHHVPSNAFLSLSLQTSIAIALHKLPEGFITYATNHANPKLGFTVFLALAIHNVSEGFALALPLFLATHSRIRALLYSLLLGGLSQPLGAGIAAAWLKIAERGRGEWAPGERVYGGMFAATAGIMASVALSLLQESLELSHRKGLCVMFVFIGMGILGVSGALTA